MDPDKSESVTGRSIAITLSFILVVQLAAIWFTSANAPVTAQSGYYFAPAGTSSFGSLSNAVILVLAVFATTLFAVWLIRSKKERVFTSIVFVGTAIALFLLTLLTAIDISSLYLSQDVSFYLSVLLAVGVVVFFALSSRNRQLSVLAPVVTGLLSAEIGSYFASTLPLLTALLLPIVFSVYDIYAVFRGPLRQLVTIAPAETLSGVTSKLGQFSIGTGDTIFYSLVPAVAFYEFGPVAALATLVAVNVGVVATLYLLTRAKMLPGLPIPMALGLATLAVFAVV